MTGVNPLWWHSSYLPLLPSVCKHVLMQKDSISRNGVSDSDGKGEVFA